MSLKAEDEEEPEPEEELEEPDMVVGPAVAMPFTPPVTAPLSCSVTSLLPIFMAAAWKLSKVLPVFGALIEPTIPMPQWVICLQWNQIGWVLSVMFMVNCVPAVRPESKPPGDEPLAARKVQGSANED